MRFVPTRVHGIMDYIVGLILIAAPWVMNFNHGGAETIVPVAIGISTIVYSLFTDYEDGLVRSLPMPTHLVMDILGGLILAASPWLFGFAGVVAAPHLIFGLLQIGLGFATLPVPRGCRTC